MSLPGDVPASFETELDLRADEVDFANRWRLSAILAAQQEMGEHHCRLLGCAHEAMQAKDAFFVLMRQRLDLNQYPGAASIVQAETWVGSHQRSVFNRFYRFSGPQGEVYATGSTTWVICSLTDRRILNPEEYLDVYPEPKYADLPLPGKLRSPGDAQRSSTHFVAYSDLDYNGHANNTKYADWCCDLFSIESHRERELSHMQINYVSELRGGENVQLDLHEAEDAFFVQGHIDSQTVFQAKGIWRLR